MRKVLVLFFSRSGVSARAARDSAAALRRRGVEVTVERLYERWRLPYPAWLLLSFMPGAAWPIRDTQNDPADFDGILFVFPKWTLSCPPVEGFIPKLRPSGPPVALLVTCGGWDQERYAASYTRKIAARGIKLKGTLCLRRRDVGSESWLGAIGKLCGELTA